MGCSTIVTRSRVVLLMIHTAAVCCRDRDVRRRIVNLALLHPGLGWIGMSIPQSSAQELAASILRCAQPAGSGRPN